VIKRGKERGQTITEDEVDLTMVTKSSGFAKQNRLGFKEDRMTVD